MDMQHEKVCETLEMKAKRALTDISNQEEFRQKQWLTKSKIKEKGKFYRQNFSNLPELPRHQLSLKQGQKRLIFLPRKKNRMYRERITQILDRTVQKPKHLPNYDINQEFTQQMKNQRMSKIFSNHISMLKSRDNTPSRSRTQVTQQRQSEESQIINFIKQRATESNQQIKNNWSLHVKKTLTGMGRMNHNVSKEIQEIKELIYDKRIKCRKLSKQGYLIVKRDSLQNLHGQYPHCIQSMQLKQKSIEKIKNRYESGAKLSSLNRLNKEQQPCHNKQNSVSKNFLRNALEILHTKHRSSLSKQKILTVIS